MVRTILVICGGVILATTMGCKGGEAKAAASKAPAVLQVSVALAASEEITRKIDVTGTLMAWEEATVSLEAEGRLIDLRVDLGDQVKKGSVLARVAPEVYELRKAQAAVELQAAAVELQAAEADFKRIESLVGKDMATRQQFDEAQRRLGLARASADRAKANADLTLKQHRDTTLYAPINGWISKRMVNAGEYVRTGTPAFTLVRTDLLKLRVDVPERFAGIIKLSDAVEVTSEALGSRTLQGTVVRISPAVSAETRSFAVEARIDNADGSVKPGIFARATLQTDAKSQFVAVPEGAVAMLAGNPRVFIVADGIAKEQPVELAGRHQGNALISKGLSGGESIVASNVEALFDGAHISIRQANGQ